MTLQQPKIEPIQYLRALAVLAVLLDHASLQASVVKYFGQAASYPLLLAGFAGVDLFFTISGFIITAVTLDASLRPRKGLALFAWNRFVRIVPTMWVAVLSLALMRYLGAGLRDGEVGYWTALTLWPFGAINPDHIWSVRQELAFYAVFALSVFTRLPGARWVFVLWWLAQVASSWVDPASLGVWGDTLLRPVNIHFGWGVLLGGLYRRGWFQRHSWGATPWLAAIQAVWVAAVVALIWAFDWQDPAVLWHKLAIGACFASLVYVSLAVQETRPGVWSRWLGFLGEASFSIYLFHVQGITVMLKLLHTAAPAMPPAAAVALTTAGALLLACLAYVWLERPLIARLRPLYGGRH